MDAPPLRKIIHIDMDAFYASVEQRDDPALRGRPLAVGGDGPRGVVAAASYEARRFGVRSAMPSARARRLCPDLLFVRPRFDAYRAVSEQIHAIFGDYTALIQPLSLDEAFLDVTENSLNEASATRIAKDIRRRIVEITGLTASAGVSYNKFLAKIASDINKPDGLCVIPPEKGEEFVASLPVRKFHGVGPATAARMERLNIRTGADLRARTREQLDRDFGKAGGYYYWASRGIDYRPVNAERERKSIGAETTFHDDLLGKAACTAAMASLIEKVVRHCARHSLGARCITLKLRHSDYRTFTRSQTLDRVVGSFDEIAGVAEMLLERSPVDDKGIRLLGVSLSALQPFGEGQGEAVVSQPLLL